MSGPEDAARLCANLALLDHLTRRMTEGATLLGILVVDHIVIGAERRFYSFAQQRVLTAAA